MPVARALLMHLVEAGGIHTSLTHVSLPLQVADFGLSRVLSQEAISTGTFGTVTHMPPELLTTGRLSKSVDTYAFGVLLWEMCTGKRPWAGMMQMQVRPPARSASGVRVLSMTCAPASGLEQTWCSW